MFHRPDGERATQYIIDRRCAAAFADQVESRDVRFRNARPKETAPRSVLAEVQGGLRALVGP
jgi:hypothetical protein